MSGFHVGETVELNIESLAFQGPGVGKKDGFVFFVDRAAPGDTISAKITSLKKKFGQGNLEKLIAPSEHRQKPLCAHFSECGGCQWQHVSYSEQIVQKQKILSRLLTGDVRVVPSPKEFAYRNRIRLHWDGSQLGMYRRKSSEVLAISDCKIAAPQISVAIEKTLVRMQKNHSGQAKHVDLYLTDNSEVHTQVSAIDDFEYPPFSQVNFEINELLKKHVSDLIPTETNLVLDLYCGSGNFSRLAKAKVPAAEVVGVEANKDSIKMAKASLPQIEFVCEDVAKYLKKWRRQVNNLTVILDPPRSGCPGAVMSALDKIRPKTLIYISCDPNTLTRDLKLLSNYTLENATGFDMFPQTYHVETVAMLKSSSI